MRITNLDTSRIAIIGPGRLGTSLAYKFGRDNKRVTIYYHDTEVCRAINKEHLNPKHLTQDLARKLGGIDKVPRLAQTVRATNDLERVVEDNDFIFLTITMNRLPEFLNFLKPLLEKKAGDTCIVSPIKGLTSDEITKELITPSQLSVKITSALGSIIRTIELDPLNAGKHKKELDLSELCAGVYLISIESPDKSVWEIRRIVIYR